MTSRRHAISEPIEVGLLEVGGGQTLHWEVSGNPGGNPAVLLHGGPGSGSSPRMRQMFDPERYLIVQFDQRNCGQSTPSAALPSVDLSTNNTAALVDDIERPRNHLGVDRWLVWGGSWGTTLGLACRGASGVGHRAAARQRRHYQQGRNRVDHAPDEPSLPRPWREFVAALPPDKRDGNLALAYNRLLMDHAWTSRHQRTGRHRIRPGRGDPGR